MKLGILLISHGSFAMGAKESMEMIMGEQDHLAVLSFREDQHVEELEAAFQKTYVALSAKCEHVLALCDIYGGTPCNVLLRRMMSGAEITAFTGLSMPLLIDIICSRDGIKDTTELIQHIHELTPMIMRQIEVTSFDEDEE